MKKLGRLSLILAGALASFGSSVMPTNDYTQRKTRVLSYKKGGSPFTRGARSKSLKVRSNRQKAKGGK